MSKYMDAVTRGPSSPKVELLKQLLSRVQRAGEARAGLLSVLRQRAAVATDGASEGRHVGHVYEVGREGPVDTVVRGGHPSRAEVRAAVATGRLQAPLQDSPLLRGWIACSHGGGCTTCTRCPACGLYFEAGVLRHIDVSHPDGA